jgi:hypothetical protein
MSKESFLRIKSKDQLRDILISGGVPVDVWNAFKGIGDLWEEVRSGETILVQRGKEVVRQVSVARIFVYYTDDNGQRYQLVETKQVRKDGNVRERGFDYVAEKFKASENPQQAALRGVGEELGISISTGLSSRGISTEERKSPSYPGLKSEYKFHLFELTLDPSQFKEEGYVEDDEKKKTYFEWKIIS